MRLLDNNECDDKSQKHASYFLFCGMTSLLRVADAEAQDRVRPWVGLSLFHDVRQTADK